jgi:hypothetical protein
MDKTTESLRKVLHDYAVPDPKIVSKLPKGGITLDFVGHADITRILIEIDPHWSIEPVAYDEAGLPAAKKIGNMIQAGFRMTLLGQTRYCVGSVEERKSDIGKELVSDAIRNGAMRFGISLSLWTKAEWEDLGATPAVTPAPRKVKAVTETKVTKPLDPETISKFIAACTNANLDHEQVADLANVNLKDNLTTDDLTKLREAFNNLKGNKK